MLTHGVSTLDLDTLCRCIGLIGFMIYVSAFFALSLGRLDSSRPAYFVLVLIASSCVMVSLLAKFNLSAALIQSFYIFISAGAIALRWARRFVPSV
ncbi:MAG: hypothetical protein AAFY38_02445 [Pseudomonadota bacterium]